MPAAWKVVLIGSEVTVLAAFTGFGLHLALQPHRPALVAPPPLVLPTSAPLLPSAGHQPASGRPATSPAAMAPMALNRDWIRRLGHDDRNLLATQWDIVQGLVSGVERYLRDTVVPEMERKR